MSCFESWNLNWQSVDRVNIDRRHAAADELILKFIKRGLIGAINWRLCPSALELSAAVCFAGQTGTNISTDCFTFRSTRRWRKAHLLACVRVLCLERLLPVVGPFTRSLLSSSSSASLFWFDFSGTAQCAQCATGPRPPQKEAQQRTRF